MYDSKYFATTPEGSVTLRPDFIQKLKCASGEHEPDEELEKLLQGPEQEGVFKSPPNYLLSFHSKEYPDFQVDIRLCKHCGCLYKEKSASK
jgi:hypothetical protein